MPKYEKYMLQPVPTFPHLTFNFQSGESRICNSYFSHRQDIFIFYQRVCLSFFPLTKKITQLPDTTGNWKSCLGMYKPAVEVANWETETKSGFKMIWKRKVVVMITWSTEVEVTSRRWVIYLSMTFKAWMSYLKLENLMLQVLALSIFKLGTILNFWVTCAKTCRMEFLSFK